MPSILPGFEYDIFISYRQKDNKHDGWVTEFVDHLKGELEATFKEDISIYFDENPHDGLLETHNVGKSLETKLKCLIFIPIISQTYCDPKSFAWQQEFCAFNQLAKSDPFGRDIRLASGNVTSRILPVKIHDLDPEDKALLENELGGVLRCIEFIYKTAGVNRPLRAHEDHPQDNLNKTYYRDQVNKVANAVKEIITGIKRHDQPDGEVSKEGIKVRSQKPKNRKAGIAIVSVLALALIVLGYFFIPELLKSSEPVDKSIAVLPFLNLSNDPEQEYFSDGMVDEILDRLVKVGDLKVISRTSSMQYKNTKLPLKEIARELGVSAILEGSVRKVGNTVRITAQLIDAKSGFHLWSDKYDRDLSDVFSIQSEVAQNVARELKAKLTKKENDQIKSAPPTTDQLAYNFYLKGNDYFSKGEWSLALEMYTKAIQEDSLFATAFAKRAKTYSILYWTKNELIKNPYLKAKEDIKKGLQLNPALSELKLAQAISYYHLDREYDKALKILDELKKEAPNLADVYAYTAFIWKRQGKSEAAANELKHAMQLDPLNAGYFLYLSYLYESIKQFDNTIELLKTGLSYIPDFRKFNLQIFYACLDKTGDLTAALNESGLREDEVQYQVYYYTSQFNKLIEFIRQDTTIQRDKDMQDTYEPKIFELGLIYYLSGNKTLCKIYADSAIAHLKSKIEEIPNDDRFYATLGKCYAFSGNDKQAIACGKKAVTLMPVILDANNGASKERDLMEIYIFTGNNDLALDKIEYLLSIPSDLSVGQLMIDPIFDKIRNLPRFQKIIESARKEMKVN